MNYARNRAFSLIELITVIAILVILMTLTIGIVKTLSTRSKVIQTQNTISTIKQALIIYQSNTGFLPRITDLTTNQYKLYDALTEKDIDIKDFKGNVVKIITQPAMNEQEIQNSDMIKEDLVSPGQYHFIDAWGFNIIYLFGEIGASYSYADQRYEENSLFYNVNWPLNYDIISSGKDGISNSNQSSRKDDITNF